MATSFEVGDRVSLIPFKHKGKVATVKYFGAIDKKIGQFVGLELDEPTGDMSGEVNGVQLFECKTMHGLVLRKTQVKPLEGGQKKPANVPSLKMEEVKNPLLDGGDLGLNDSPLITPKQGGMGGDKPLLDQPAQKPEAAATTASSMAAAKKDGANKGWRERLEGLRKQRNLEKQQKEEEEAKKTASQAEAASLRSSFAPATGIQKDADGNLTVNQKATAEKVSPEKILQQTKARQAEALAKPTPAKNLSINTADDSKGKSPMKGSDAPTTTTGARAPASRIGGASKTSGVGSTTGVRQPTTTTAKAAAERRQTITQKKEQLAKERESRQTATGVKKTTGIGATTGTTTRASATTATTASRTSTTGGMSSRQSGVTSARNSNLRGSQTGASKFLSGSNASATTAAKTGTTATGRTTAANASPMRTRQGRTGVTTPASKSPMKATRFGQGGAKAADSAASATTATGRTTARATSRQATTRTGSNTRSGISSNQPPVNNLQLKQLEAQLREKNEEAYSLQVEVKNLSSKIEQLNNEHEEYVNALVQKHQQDKVDLEANMIANHQQDKANLEVNMNSGNSELLEKIAEKDNQLDEHRKQIAAKEKEIEDKNRELDEVRTQVSEIQSQADANQSSISQEQMSELNANKDQAIKDQEEDFNKKKTELEEGHAKTIDELNQQLLTKEKELAEKLLEKEDELTKVKAELKAKNDEYASALAEVKKELEEERKKTADALEEAEGQKLELETLQLEMDALQDEKEEIMRQMAEQNSKEDEELYKNMGADELRNQNRKLRNAIQTLTTSFEVEKQKFVEKIADESGKQKIISEYEKKLQDMDFLIEEVENKEAERLEMEEKLEEMMEYEEMVEEMVNEISKKEEENEELEARIQELEEENVLQEELNEQLEQYNKELTGEVANKDAEIADLQNQLSEMEDLALDQESQKSKYKEKYDEMKVQIKTLSDQLSDALKADDGTTQIRRLVDKQNQLIAQLREADKKELSLSNYKIQFWQNKMRCKIVENFIPARLQEEACLVSLDRVQEMNIAKNKALLLIRDLCEKQFSNAKNVYEEEQQRDKYLAVLIGLAQQCVDLIDCSSRTLYFIQLMTIGQYKKATQLSSWSKFSLLIKFIDKVSEELKEGQLSYKLEADEFYQGVKTLVELRNKVEAIFVDKTPEEIEDEKKNETNSHTMSIEQQTRIQQAKYCPKLEVRSAMLNMALGVSCLQNLARTEEPEDAQAILQKTSLIYWRVIDIILKLDNIDGQNNGHEFLDLEDIGTDKKLIKKFESLRTVWIGSLSEVKIARGKDWMSVLEAVERDLSQLNTHYKFKQLIKKIDEFYGEEKIELDDLYVKGWDSQGPWTLVAQNIQKDLQNTDVLKDKIENLQEKQKEQMIQFLTVKKEKDEAIVAKDFQENRLSEALSKADKVPALEIEKKNLKEGSNRLQKQIEALQVKLQEKDKTEQDLLEKLEEAKKNPGPASGNRGEPEAKSSFRKQGPSHQSRASRTSAFFQTMAKSSFFDKKGEEPTPTHHRNQSSMGNAEILKNFQHSEENFVNIIYELQTDRMKMKGRQIMERLQKLQREEGAFNTLIQRNRQRNELQIKLNTEEQGKLEETLTNVSQLKSKVKRQMAKARVVDFTAAGGQAAKRTSASQEQANAEPKKEESKDAKDTNSTTAEGSSSANTTKVTDVSQKDGDATVKANKDKESINFMLIKAKQEVDNAMKMLFPNDSSFYNYSTSSGASTAATENVVTRAANQSSDIVESSLTKIGEISLVPSQKQTCRLIKKKRVILDNTAVNELKRNLGVFANGTSTTSSLKN